MSTSRIKGSDDTIAPPAERGYPTFDAPAPGQEGLRHLSEGDREPDEAGDVFDDALSSRMRLVLVVALASIIVGGTADLIMDRPTTWVSFHVIFETLMIAGALVMATTLWLSWWRSERDAAVLRASLAVQREAGAEWRATAQHALEGLARAIDAQFEQWQLTPTEREIALLLLKGHGHKQIAALTNRSERTVRQHASTIYDKAHLASRAELAAYFLQDLMLPDRERSGFADGQREVESAR